MSVDASRRLSALAPPWLRYGLIAGIFAFSCTLAANLAATWVSPADLCRVGFIFVSSAEHRFQEAASVCAGPVPSGGGSFSFNFGPTPPPGAFATPPPGAFVFPPSAGGIVGQLMGMVFTILIGTAAATGAATIAGQVGIAARSRAMQRGTS